MWVNLRHLNIFAYSSGLREVIPSGSVTDCFQFHQLLTKANELIRWSFLRFLKYFFLELVLGHTWNIVSMHGPLISSEVRINSKECNATWMVFLISNFTSQTFLSSEALPTWWYDLHFSQCQWIWQRGHDVFLDFIPPNNRRSHDLCFTKKRVQSQYLLTLLGVIFQTRWFMSHPLNRSIDRTWHLLLRKVVFTLTWSIRKKTNNYRLLCLFIV